LSVPLLVVVMAAWVFVFGCLVGSFLNVCIYRLPRGMSVRTPERSFCPQCENPIAWYDNIPLVSYIALRGRCRRCSESISWRYPVVEGLTGLLFAGIYLRQSAMMGVGVGEVIVMMLVGALLIVAAGVDSEFLIIPDEVSIFGLVAGLVAGSLLPQLHVGAGTYHTFARLTGLANLDGLIASAVGALVGGGVVFAFALIGRFIFKKEALGFGDVKLLAMVGAFLGWKVALMTFFLAPFFGIVYGLPLLLLRDEHVMPFGPFLSMAGGLVLIFRSHLCMQLLPLERLMRFLFAG